MKPSTLLVLVPVAAVAVLFALANRQEIVLRFAPFARGESPLSLSMPLYLLVFFVFFLGVLVGGATVAFSRRIARSKRLKAREIGDAIVGLDAEKPGADSSGT